MSTKNIKFEISLKELVVKFEGSIDQAKDFQGQVAGAQNSLASVQGRMLAPPTKVDSSQGTAPLSNSRKTRKRRPSAVGIDPAIVEGLPEAGTDGDPADSVIDVTPTRKRTGTGTTDLIVALKSEGFFLQKRTNASIREELARKGHTFKSNEINPVLVKLTQKNVLKRDKNGDQWIYFVG